MPSVSTTFKVHSQAIEDSQANEDVIGVTKRIYNGVTSSQVVHVVQGYDFLNRQGADQVRIQDFLTGGG